MTGNLKTPITNKKDNLTWKEQWGGFIHHNSNKTRAISIKTAYVSYLISCIAAPFDGLVSAFKSVSIVSGLGVSTAVGSFTTLLVATGIGFSTLLSTRLTQKYKNAPSTKTKTNAPLLAFTLGFGLPAFVGGTVYNDIANRLNPQTPVSSTSSSTQNTYHQETNACKKNERGNQLVEEFHNVSGERKKTSAGCTNNEAFFKYNLKEPTLP